MAALSRDVSDNPADFYLYMDEFQNITTNSIAQILSEARKFRLSLNIAHQFIGQLQEDIKKAVFGNVGSLAIFRIKQEDAKFLEEGFKPMFNANDMSTLPNRNCYVNLLVNGSPQRPFSMVTMAPEYGDKNLANVVKELSSLKYGTKKEDIEDMIMAKFALAAEQKAKKSKW
jgi:DNA helicase HerA-like ATPase